MSIGVPPSPATEFQRNFKRADYIAINNYLDGILWDDDLRYLNIDDAVDFLYRHLVYAISTFVPVFLVKRIIISSLIF